MNSVAIEEASNNRFFDVDNIWTQEEIEFLNNDEKAMLLRVFEENIIERLEKFTESKKYNDMMPGNIVDYYFKSVSSRAISPETVVLAELMNKLVQCYVVAKISRKNRKKNVKVVKEVSFILGEYFLGYPVDFKSGELYRFGEHTLDVSLILLKLIQAFPFAAPELNTICERREESYLGENEQSLHSNISLEGPREIMMVDLNPHIFSRLLDDNNTYGTYDTSFFNNRKEIDSLHEYEGNPPIFNGVLE